jgi:outer membrane protein
MKSQNSLYHKYSFYLPMIVILFVGSSEQVKAQHDSIRLSLQEIIDLAQSKSISFLKAKTSKENSYWQWRNFKSDYNPQLSFAGTLPEITSSYQETTQPDGSILYQPVFNSNTSLGMSLSQAIFSTGGTVFMRSDVKRYDDLQRKSNLYLTVPFQIGIVQPLFKYNTLKWNRKIEPLKYTESLKVYFEDIENIGLVSANLFFEVLIAQVGYEIASVNFENNKIILKIAEERNLLGKNSRNDVLQLKLAQINARKELSNAKVQSETAQLNLKKYVGFTDDVSFSLLIPSFIPNIKVDSKIALQNAWENRSAAVSFERKTLEADAKIAEAKGQNGFSAKMEASLGYNSKAIQFNKSYENLKDQKYVALSLNIPILDWGRSKSRMETALANKRLVQYTVEQDQINFEQEVTIQVSQFQLNFEQLDYTKEADSFASERYKIALERYTMGNFSITELIIAMNEKDKARADYIMALKQYWTSFYKLRLLTLYDFAKNQKIEY